MPLSPHGDSPLAALFMEHIRPPAGNGWHLRNFERAVERDLYAEIRTEASRLLGEQRVMTPSAEDEAQIRAMIADQIAAYQRRAVTTNAPQLPDPAASAQRLFDRLLRLGILQPLMDAPRIEEIICNEPNRIFVIEDGRKRLCQELAFENDEEMLQMVKRLVGAVGRRLDESSPMVDVQLPDGSRLNAAIPPATTRGTVVTIRKFLLRASSLEQLVQLGMLPEPAAQFLDAAVQAGVNILISGPTGSGKTTFLNALVASIADPAERVVTIEEVAELHLTLPDKVALQARASNVEGAGEIKIRELVKNALRMRPTRIIVGEVRGGEALDMLQAMNTGHEGSLATIHGNNPRDALDRLVLLAMMAEERLDAATLTKMVAQTIELVIQLRFEPRSGRRRVAGIYEVGGLEGSVLTGNDLWVYDPVQDRLGWTGIQPRCLAKLVAQGIAYTLPSAVDGTPR